ncbi:hypothetical protein [Streptomyces sediminimaris]|uniref:hypothetical protein n=1 Tax=Streptomyces sediminimaris TaxID=3383721 RepID=UPI00399B18E7
MNGTASAAQWLACSGIGCGTGALFLALIKLALDEEPVGSDPADRVPAYQPPPALPSHAPRSLRWHAAPPRVDETQPIRVQHHARHAKKAA